MLNKNDDLEEKNKFTKVINKMKSFLSSPLVIITLISLLFLGYTIIYPIWDIIANTFISEDNTFTLSWWKRVLSSDISEAIFYKPLKHTLSIGFTASILATFLGGTLAWILIKTDIKFKKTIGFFLILPYMLPSWFKAFAWLIVFKNDRVGGSPGLVQAVFNVTPPDWLSYGFLPIVLTMTTHYYAFSFLLVSAALSSLNSSLEEQAGILGANRLTVLRKITFPLILPAILSSFILTISKGLGTFGIPAFLGLPTKYYTISTMLFSSIRAGRSTDGFVLSLILITLASLIIYFNQRALKKRNYEVVGGKSSRTNLVSLGRWRKPVSVSVWLFITIVAIAPLILLLLQTVMLRNGIYSFENFSLHYWLGDSTPTIANGNEGVLKNSRVLLAIKNSVVIALTASIIAALIGLIFGYVITRERKLFTSKLLDQFSFLPYLIPGIALSAIYLTLFSKQSFLIPSLYGTISILILITLIKELPFATRAGTSTMIQIGSELEEAAKIEGASWFKRFFKILFPLSKAGVFSGFILVFISAMKELDLLVLLVTPKTNTLTTLTFEFTDKGFPQFSNAIVIIIVVIIVVIYFLATKIGKADITKGIGGS